MPLVEGVRRVSVKQAAGLLGTTEHAVRQRLHRGTLRTEKNEQGNVTVLVPETLIVSPGDSASDSPGDTREAGSESALVEALRDQNRILEEQLREANESNRENRRIIAGLTQRIPELEASRASVTSSEEASKGDVPPEEERRSWWRRFFGFGGG